jgi:hypothetical protein
MRKCNWIDFGWFGPCLTFNKNNDPEEPNRLVISLFICKLYITIPKLQKSYKKLVCIDYKVYGLDSGSDPDRLVWMWGDYHRVFRMPWTPVIVSRCLCNNWDNKIDNDILMSYEDCKKAATDNPNRYMQHGTYFMSTQAYVDYDYFITCIKVRPLIFKDRNWKWCTKSSYEVHTNLEKQFNGINELKFNTDVDILIGQQINLQLMTYDKFYTDF